MKAAVLHRAGEPLSIEDVRIDAPGPNEIRVRTTASGICHSDFAVAHGTRPGRFPVILGHEAAGIVEAKGAAVSRIEVGDQIVTSPFAFCGVCRDCLHGRISICANPGSRRPRGTPPRLWTESADGARTSIHPFSDIGGFASELLVHERQCVAIDHTMPADRAAIMGCAVVTGIGAVMRSARVAPGESVAVLGCGGVGLAAVQGARIAGAGRIVAIDRAASNLEIAARMGATDLIDAVAEEDVADAVLQLTGGGVQHCIEAVGSRVTIEQAYAMLRRGGLATVVGLAPAGSRIELDPEGFALEKRIGGSLMGSNHFPVDLPRYVTWYLEGRLDLDTLVSRTVALDQVNEVFDEMHRGGATGRTVIVFDE